MTTVIIPGRRNTAVALCLSVLLHGVVLGLVISGFNKMIASENARHDVDAEAFSVLLVPASALQAAPDDEPVAVQSTLPSAPETPVEKPEIVINRKRDAVTSPETKPVTAAKKPVQSKPVRKKTPLQAKGETLTTTPMNARAQGTAQASSPDAGPKGAATQTIQTDSSNGEKATYLAKVRIAIEKNKVYPRRARQKRTEGQTGVEIRLDEQGNIVSARLSSGSGDASLDEAALNAARRAKSSGPPPAGMSRTMVLQIEFSLHKR